MISWLAGLPPLLVYLVLGAGAALENLLPVIPADTFVVLGGFLAAQGRAAPIGVFLATWGGNVIVALLVYRAAWHYGPAFFTGGMGQRLLKPRQLQRLAIFYRRWGPWAIFLTRFLPGFRAVVPVFAGVTHQPLLPVAIPLAVASAIWYGLLTWAGTIAGRNLDGIVQWLSQLNRGLLVVSLVFALAIGLWWRRSRGEPEEQEGGLESQREESPTQ